MKEHEAPRSSCFYVTWSCAALRFDRGADSPALFHNKRALYTPWQKMPYRLVCLWGLRSDFFRGYFYVLCMRCRTVFICCTRVYVSWCVSCILDTLDYWRLQGTLDVFFTYVVELWVYGVHECMYHVLYQDTLEDCRLQFTLDVLYMYL